MNIAWMIFAFIRDQYAVKVHIERFPATPGCKYCVHHPDYALVNFGVEFQDGDYPCDGCGAMIRVKEIK